MVGRVGRPRLALQFCWRVILPTYRGAVAQEFLDFALVAVRRSAIPLDRRDPQVLGEGLDGLARCMAQRRSRGLELAVVDAAAEAQLGEHLGRHVDAERA